MHSKRIIYAVMAAVLGIVITAGTLTAARSDTVATEAAFLSTDSFSAARPIEPIPAADWQSDSITANSRYGQAVISIDWDNDFDLDVVVGAPREARPGFAGDPGAIYFYENVSGTIAVTPTLTLYGTQGGERFGSAVAAGDFNGDGLQDLAVGAPEYRIEGSSTGAVYVLSQASVTFFAQPMEPAVMGIVSGSRFGYALARTADFSSGFDDQADELFVGAPGKNSNAGAVYGFVSKSPAGITGTADLVLTGTAGSQFGYSLATANYNAEDGRLNDLIIGAPTAGVTTTGRVEIHELGEDFEGGFEETLLATFVGGQSGSQFGYFVGAAQIDGDTRDDILIGAPTYLDENDEPVGAAAVFLAPSGLRTPTAQRVPQIEADWAALGTQSGSFFGASMTAVDFDLSGQMDVVVGAPLYTFAHTAEGAVFFFLPDDVGVLPPETPGWIAAGNYTGHYFGAQLAPMDLFDLNAYELLVGAPSLGDIGRVYYYAQRSDVTPVFGSSGLLTAEASVAGNETVFQATPPSGSNGTDMVYWWQLGDGFERLTASTFDAPQTLFYAYPLADRYTATVAALNPISRWDAAVSLTVTQPLSNVLVTSDLVNEGESTTFTVTAVTGDFEQVVFDFGDGSDPATYSLTSGESISYTYQGAGIYNVRVTAFQGSMSATGRTFALVARAISIGPNSGGDLTSVLGGGTQTVTLSVEPGSVSETINLQMVPVDDGTCGGTVFANRLGDCFDIEVERLNLLRTPAVPPYCVFLPFVVGGGGSGSGGGTPLAGDCGVIENDQYEFLKPITITVRYNESILPTGVNEDEITLQYFDEGVGRWLDGATTCEGGSEYVRDTVNNIIKLPVCHQSRWAFG